MNNMPFMFEKNKTKENKHHQQQIIHFSVNSHYLLIFFLEITCPVGANQQERLGLWKQTFFLGFND